MRLSDIVKVAKILFEELKLPNLDDKKKRPLLAHDRPEFNDVHKKRVPSMNVRQEARNC